MFYKGFFLSQLPSISNIPLSRASSINPWTYPPNIPYRTPLSQISLYLEQQFLSRCNYSVPISNFLLACSVIQVSYRVSFAITAKPPWFEHLEDLKCEFQNAKYLKCEFQNVKYPGDVEFCLTVEYEFYNNSNSARMVQMKNFIYLFIYLFIFELELNLNFWIGGI